MTKIEWTDTVFNPWQGCTKVSPGCKNCYAERLAGRNLWGKKVSWGANHNRIRNSAEYWKRPLEWNRKAIRENRRIRVFAASMADIFDEQVAPSWRSDFWNLVRECPHLDWQILTKRPQNICEMLPNDWESGWPNVWLGTSVEDQTRVEERVPILSQIPASVRFLSAEPLLGHISPDLTGIQWVICGGESGPGFRPMDPSWVRNLRDQCQAAQVAFFFKQWGTSSKKMAGRNLDGFIWNDFPQTTNY